MQREIEKIRGKNLILANECEHLRAINNDYAERYKKIQDENEDFLEEIQNLKKELSLKKYNQSVSQEGKDFVIENLNKTVTDLKNKYNRVKEKCWKLNQENDFYNQTITVFITIKKVLEKQVKFTNLLYECSINNQMPRDIQLDQNFGYEERLPSARSSASKRNIFEKKGLAKNEDEQAPEELKQGIQVCNDKLV